MTLKVTDKLKCLLVHPEFSAFSFWNYKDAAETLGAKTPSPPLGLITVAALLPDHWEFRLLDLNAQEFDESMWNWADMICVGGMLPQQKGIMEVIDRANRDGKFVMCGGADPTSQPNLYQNASMLCVGEGEDILPRWLEESQTELQSGVWHELEKPDVTLSPIPRFDLLDFNNYVQLAVQYSRGCPFNCEFCDIIELFGRKPRTKTPAQILSEFNRLLELGYSGPVDLVDDNFIGNKRLVKRELLPAIKEWNDWRGHPFYFCTEASMNMADDVKLLELMRDSGFRVIFMGIETPDPDLLLMTQKSQNTVRPVVERIRKIYEYGMVVTAGFIMGFDGEKKGMDKSMVDLIEDAGINMAMVGLLVALPNTQLTRRLVKEGRLLSFRGELISSEDELFKGAQESNSALKIVDQTIAGLNFVPTRDRVDILEEYSNVVRQVYDPRAYFDRALRVGLQIKTPGLHKPRWFALKRIIYGGVRCFWKLTKKKETRWLFWRNVLRLIPKGPTAIEQTVRLMGIFPHFQQQSRFLLSEIERQIEVQKNLPREAKGIRSLDLLKEFPVKDVPETDKHDRVS